MKTFQWRILACIVFSLIFSLTLPAQSFVTWSWKDNQSITFTDIISTNNTVFACGYFSAPTVTLGSFTLTNAGSRDMVLAKLDTNGNVLWANRYGGIQDDALENLEFDNNGGVYAVGNASNTFMIGSTTVTNQGSDIFFIHVNGNGVVQQAHNMGGLGYDTGTDIARDYQGNLFISAQGGGFSFGGTMIPNQCAMILKCNSQGSPLFPRWLNGTLNYIHNTESEYETAKAIKYSSFDTTIVLAGEFGIGDMQYDLNNPVQNSNNVICNIGSFNNQDYYICKIKLNGDLVQLSNLAGTYNKTNKVGDLVIIPSDGSYFISHRFQFSLNGFSTNSWLRFDLQGNNISSNELSSDGNWGGIPMCNGIYGSGFPGKMSFSNNTLHGLLYQPELFCGVLGCTYNYIVNKNIATNTFDYDLLDPGSTFQGIAHHTSNVFAGNSAFIGKICNANCNQPAFSLNPAPDVSLCVANAMIGLPECFYTKGGTPSYQYSWSPSTGLSATNVAQPSVSGITSSITYTLTVTDALSNVAHDTVTVYIGQPNSSFDTVALCASNLPYSWNGNLLSYAGNYVAVFTNASGCDSTVYLSLQVTQPYINTVSASTCAYSLPYVWQGNNYYAAGVYSYTPPGSTACDTLYQLNLNVVPNGWNDPAPVQNNWCCSSQLPFTWIGGSATAGGSYTTNYTSSSGCTYTITLNLTVYPSDTNTTNLSLCDNQLPYTWNAMNLTTSGTYSYLSMNQNGCDSLSILNLTVNNSSSGTTVDSACGSYTWSLPLGDGNVYTTSNNTATHVSTNAAGCLHTQSLQLTVYPNPQPMIVLVGSVLSTTQSYTTYQWYLNGVAITGATAMTYQPVANGNYTVLVTDSNGCSATSPIMNYQITSTSLSELDTELTIMPNPTSDYVVVQLNNNNHYTGWLKVTDAEGRMLERIYVKQSNSIRMNLSNYANGIYLLNLEGMQRTLRVCKSN